MNFSGKLGETNLPTLRNNDDFKSSAVKNQQKRYPIYMRQLRRMDQLHQSKNLQLKMTRLVGESNRHPGCFGNLGGMKSTVMWGLFHKPKDPY